MKRFLLIVDAQEGFLAKGVTDETESMLKLLLESNCFDCVISSVYQNFPHSNILGLSGQEQLLTPLAQKVTDVVAAHTHHYVYKTTYSAYSEDLAAIMKEENGGSLPECVFVVGFDLDRCVLMTATDLFEHGIRPMVLTEYCSSSGGDAGKFAGIRTLETLIGRNNIYHGIVSTPSDVDRIPEQAKAGIHTAPYPSEKKAPVLIDLLLQKGWRISFAESCTGGRAAAGIVDVANASSVFDSSFVTYANAAKIDLVDVSPNTIREYGVVSEAVAGEMAVGAAKKSSAQVGVGISGVAGPGGGTATKPVGMVCFGFYIDGVTHTRTVQFGAIGRNAVRQASVNFVYETLIQLLTETN